MTEGTVGNVDKPQEAVTDFSCNKGCLKIDDLQAISWDDRTLTDIYRSQDEMNGQAVKMKQVDLTGDLTVCSSEKFSLRFLLIF